MSNEIKYRNGLPTGKCIRELILEFWGDTTYAPYINAAYQYTGGLIWQRKGVNERVVEFIKFLTERGITVKGHRIYESPTTGAIWILNKNNNP
jgi:hypothetical protein